MLRTRRILIRLIALGGVAGVTGLGLKAQTPVDVAPHGSFAVARDISGTWEGTFSLDSTWKLAERPSARAVPARLHFDPVGDASPTTSSARSVHPGTFEIDFARFGFTLSTQQALGWSLNDDTMRATLNPTVDHGLVEVHGAFRGDAIVGTWRYVSDPGGAAGRFEIRRTR
ncbi:MAG TPA: hypothetical protein VL308_06180 [Gemmatimonadaceae bacterium]|jgi:hypothetical protein|nr:hypothetical protein [Gemmatimonadaceae bacterium]